MTINLTEKEYFELLKATGDNPVKVFQHETNIFMEGALMAHKAKCTIHSAMRCDCHPELNNSNEILPPFVVYRS